jgi:hypothetical protein
MEFFTDHSGDVDNIYFFVLIQKSNKKNQGEPECLRPFRRPTPRDHSAFLKDIKIVIPCFRHFCLYSELMIVSVAVFEMT